MVEHLMGEIRHLRIFNFRIEGCFSGLLFAIGEEARSFNLSGRWKHLPAVAQGCKVNMILLTYVSNILLLFLVGGGGVSSANLLKKTTVVKCPVCM